MIQYPRGWTGRTGPWRSRRRRVSPSGPHRVGEALPCAACEEKVVQIMALERRLAESETALMDSRKT